MEMLKYVFQYFCVSVFPTSPRLVLFTDSLISLTQRKTRKIAICNWLLQHQLYAKYRQSKNSHI